MRFGEFTINTFVEQRFKLDGGAMFGVIPKKIWQRLIEADEDNLIPMVTNLFVLKAHGKNMLFDAGLGDSLSDKEKKIYGTRGESQLEAGLARLGLNPEDIDYVLLTHLHTDHAAGAVKKIKEEFVPRFPNALYYLSRTEFDLAMTPDERTAAVYIPERLKALKRSGQVHFVECDSQLFPGIRALFTGGHTRGHYALEITSGDTSVFYYADIYCTTAHLKVPYVPGTDLYPVETMRIKRATLPRIVNHNVVMAFDHDVNYPLARITDRGDGLKIEPVTGD
ncbi:MAG TPA: MBL fold metallo-hydrolase [candidate division Zixibacteria bacterium]|nr:MBL fold metallo-hydrolase [candidate division Zixibacteria bacterium]